MDKNISTTITMQPNIPVVNQNGVSINQAVLTPPLLIRNLSQFLNLLVRLLFS